MSENKSSSSAGGGAGCLTILAIGMFLLFLGLKLTGHIDWPWWQVSMPLIVLAGLTAVIIVIALVVMVAILVIKLVIKSRKKKSLDYKIRHMLDNDMRRRR